MTDALNTSDYIFRSISLAIGIVSLIIALVALYADRKKKAKAIFSIPVRRIYLLLACVFVIIQIYSAYQNDYYLYFVDVAISISVLILFLSSNIIVVNDGIYLSCLRLTRWEEITNISEDFMSFTIHTPKGIIKNKWYAKFIFKINKRDIEQLKTILANKNSSEPVAPPDRKPLACSR